MLVRGEEVSEIEDEVRASLVADLSLSHVFYHDAEYEADDLLKRLKKEWAHELAEEWIKKIEDPGTRFGLGYESAVGVIKREVGIPEESCPYTHAHTRHWCGYDTCRES